MLRQPRLNRAPVQHVADAVAHRFVPAVVRDLESVVPETQGQSAFMEMNSQTSCSFISPEGSTPKGNSLGLGSSRRHGRISPEEKARREEEAAQIRRHSFWV